MPYNLIWMEVEKNRAPATDFFSLILHSIQNYVVGVAAYTAQYTASLGIKGVSVETQYMGFGSNLVAVGPVFILRTRKKIRETRTKTQEGFQMM